MTLQKTLLNTLSAVYIIFTQKLQKVVLNFINLLFVFLKVFFVVLGPYSADMKLKTGYVYSRHDCYLCIDWFMKDL